MNPVTAQGGEIAQLVKVWVGYPGGRGMNPVTATAFSCAVIYFPVVYNLQHHQSPVPFIPCLYGVGD